MIDTAEITVRPPDGTAAEAVRDRLGSTETYGRLGDLAALLAGAGVTTPQRAVLLRPDADDRLAASGLAVQCGVLDRTLDVPPGIDEAFASGRAAVDAEVDSGADLLLAAGTDSAASARAAVAALTGSEPVHLVGWPSAGHDEEWMQHLVAVRESRRLVSGHSAEAEELLDRLGDPTLAVLTGVAVQAAVRRTLLVLDGVTALGAAAVAHRLAPAALAWWVAADRCLDPTCVLVVAHLGVECVLDLDLRAADGTAALLAANLVASSGRIAQDG